jgi:hypothetical protein
MITTGNFQDLVLLELDTLSYLGPDLEIGNTSVGSSATIGFNNTAGDLQLVGVATGNATIFLPSKNGTLLENINVSAGTTSNLMSAVTFSNSNNVSFGLNGSTITASATVASTQASINVSAGTTSNNVSAITFSNGSNVSFGLNGSTLTASVASSLTAINVSAGTTSNNLSAMTFSNSNGVSFGLNGSVVTASVAAAGAASINISAGTTSNNLTAVTFANSNGVSFGLNGSVVTAALGGISSWNNGAPVTAMTGGQGTLFLQPLFIDYAITATQILWLASIANAATNSSGGFSVSAALYSINGALAGGGASLSLASSASSNITWTSGAALSSNTGINYQEMTVASWNITPGPYVFGWWISTQNSATMSYYGTNAQPSISSGQVARMSTMVLAGYSQATVAAMPSSIGVSNTASYIRTGATAAEQPYIVLQGT